MTRNKIIILSLFLILALSMTIIPGCGGEETTPATSTPASGTPTTVVTQTTTTPPITTTATLSPQQLQKLFSDSVAALQKINSYKFDMNMNMSMEVVGGTDPGKIEILTSSTGAVNQATSEMSMNLDMSIDSDVPSMDAELENMSIEMYVLEGYMYMKMDLLGMGAQWIKVPYSEEMEEMYSMNVMDQQMDLLESVTDVKFERYDTIDGSECYVLSIVPDMKEIMSWVGEEMPTELDTSTIDQFSEIFKDLMYTVWITRDTGLMLKMDALMRMDMSADMFDGDEDLGNMTTDISMTLKVYDHNKPVSIILPAEAENAMEMPGT